MSKMSAPTPLYTVTRPEDLANLNNELMTLAVDERLRIKAVGDVVLTKTANAYYAEATVTLNIDGYPAVMAFVKIGTDWVPMPSVTSAGAAAIAISEVVKVKSITYSAGTVTITFRQDVNSTDYGNTTTRYIRYFVLKDKLEN